MQLKRMLVYSLCVVSMGAWYKEVKSCCPYEPNYGYSSSNNGSCEPWELCPSDSRWCSSKHNVYLQATSIAKGQEVKVIAVKKYTDNEKAAAKKAVPEVAQFDIRWQEEEPKKTTASYDLRWK